MPNILHRIGTEQTTVAQMYEALSTIKGLASWWTTRISGESRMGGKLQFLFSGGGPEFEVIELKPQERVEWKCVNGPKEWIDTHIEFIVTKEDQETILLFRHCGWREEVEFMHHCSTQWAYFLIGLRKFLETGKGTPYGETFESISLWSK